MQYHYQDLNGGLRVVDRARAAAHCISGHCVVNLRQNFQSFCVRVFNLKSCHLRLTLGPPPPPSMHTHKMDIEKASGQAAQFNM
jgi:hypothetical protein